ncbi:MAG: DUF1056 family protein [Herbinix sp.]|nr:DUF1056 family protein [Herbinix sp.]
MKQKILNRIYKWSDVILLVFGMIFISIGMFFILIPAGLITIGICLISLAFFIAAKQAKGG